MGHLIIYCPFKPIFPQWEFHVYLVRRTDFIILKSVSIPDWLSSSLLLAEGNVNNLKLFLVRKLPFKKILLYNSNSQFSFANSQTREVHNQYTNPPSSLYNASVYMSVLQGDSEWKGQFHECWKSGDCIWAHADEAPWGQYPHHPPWHAVPKADCADFNRKRRCFVLIHQGSELNGPRPI